MAACPLRLLIARIYSPAQSIRKTYEQIVKRLKEERIGFDNQLAAIERTLKAKEKDLEELVLMSHDAQVHSERLRGSVWINTAARTPAKLTTPAQHAKEVAKAELLKQEHRLMEEKRQREKELADRRALVQQKAGPAPPRPAPPPHTLPSLRAGAQGQETARARAHVLRFRRAREAAGSRRPDPPAAIRFGRSAGRRQAWKPAPPAAVRQHPRGAGAACRAAPAPPGRARRGCTRLYVDCACTRTVSVRGRHLCADCAKLRARARGLSPPEPARGPGSGLPPAPPRGGRPGGNSPAS